MWQKWGCDIFINRFRKRQKMFQGEIKAYLDELKEKKKAKE